MAIPAPTTDGGDRVCKYHGCLTLCFGPNSLLLATFTRLLEHQTKRSAVLYAFTQLPTTQWHVTIVTKAELRTLSNSAVTEARALSSSRVFPVGLGGVVSARVYFIVCVWPSAQAFRKRHGLPPRAFHVSVSEQNRHDVNKSVTALLSLDDASWMDVLGLDTLEAVAQQLILDSQPLALTVATHVCATCATETILGWLHLGDAALQQHKYKLAMLSFAYEYECIRADTRTDEPTAAQRICLVGIQTSSAFTEWGHVFLAQEAAQDEVPTTLAPFLLHQRWSDALCRAIRKWPRSTIPIRRVSSRKRLYVVSNTPLLAAPGRAQLLVRLPRFFRWIVPFQLAAMSTPRNATDIVHLAHSVGVQHVVTLTQEQPLPRAWFPSSLPNAVVNTFIPVANYAAPTLAQIDVFIRICCGTTGVLVHCGGGKGRAGVMVACYLVAFGFNAPPASLMEHWEQPAMAADEAIRALRTIRPGSIETDAQEAIVAAYSSLLWKRLSVFPVPVEEPPCRHR